MEIVLILLAVAVVLFATEALPVDVTALLLLSALLVTGQLSTGEALAGFGSETVITLAALFILTRALVRTGVIEMLGRFLGRKAGDARGTVRLVLATVAGVSAFTSNTATTAVFLPVMLGLARRAGLSPGRVMMPLAFASILGGTITVIGTSTNLVVAGIITRYGLEPLGFFELAWVGLPITLLGMTYLYLIAPRLLPEQEAALEERYELRSYLADLTLNAGSPLAGRSLRDSGFGRDYGLTVVAVQRDGNVVSAPGPEFVLAEGDKVVVEGSSERLIAAKSSLGVHIKPERQLLEQLEGSRGRSAVRLVEVLVMPRSPLLGRTLREARFRERYGLSVLALHRRSRVQNAMSRTRLQAGDMLLVQGPQERVVSLGQHLTVVSDVTEQTRDTRRAPLAVVVFAAAVLLGALGVLPLAAAVLVGAALVLALRIIAPEEGYLAIEWPILVLVASMLAFGTAFEQSGAADWLASLLAGALQAVGPYGLLAGFFLLTVLLTQPMSNQAAALVILPLAVNVAETLGYSPRPFAIAVAIAASNSFLTPLEPASLLVFGPGRYRFVDFIRVGGGLTLLTFVVAMLIIPWRWPF